MRKAITFRPASIGDALMGKYFLENIRARFPDTRCGIIVGTRSGMIRDLFAAEPWIEILEANRRSPRSLLSLFAAWRGSDAVLTNYTAGTLNILTKLIGRLLARRGALAGFDDGASVNAYLYDHLIPRPVRDREVRLHECDALQALGVPVAVRELRLRHVPLPGTPERFGIHGSYVVVHLFAGSKTRGLSVARMRELLAELSKVLPDATFVLSGGASDAAEATEASEGFRAVVIAGKASLQELMNLISGSRAVVSLDTGVGHIAAHLGRPPVILSTCLGRISWWGTQQYGAGIPAALFTREDLCASGHAFKPYPDCLAHIDMRAVARSVQ